MYMYSQTITLTNIITAHVTLLGSSELMTKTPDAIWNHLAIMINIIVAK